MTALRNAGRLGLATCTALALAIGASAEAHAATGNFTYTDVDGVDHTWADPPDGECLSFGLPATGADNETDATATVYGNTDCSGSVLDRIPPKTGKSWGAFRPNAVRFNFL
ncbi:hypothetical protein ACPCTO_34080 [Streptomyces olivoreticuli]